MHPVSLFDKMKYAQQRLPAFPLSIDSPAILQCTYKLFTYVALLLSRMKMSVKATFQNPVKLGGASKRTLKFPQFIVQVTF